MGLSVDRRKIVKARIVPWEPRPSPKSRQPNAGQRAEYGIAYEVIDGLPGADRIGTKQEAERIIAAIRDRRVQASATR
jgi:hypothetical protein